MGNQLFIEMIQLYMRSDFTILYSIILMDRQLTVRVTNWINIESDAMLKTDLWLLKNLSRFGCGIALSMQHIHAR